MNFCLSRFDTKPKTPEDKEIPYFFTGKFLSPKNVHFFREELPSNQAAWRFGLSSARSERARAASESRGSMRGRLVIFRCVLSVEDSLSGSWGVGGPDKATAASSLKRRATRASLVKIRRGSPSCRCRSASDDRRLAPSSLEKARERRDTQRAASSTSESRDGTAACSRTRMIYFSHFGWRHGEYCVGYAVHRSWELNNGNF